MKHGGPCLGPDEKTVEMVMRELMCLMIGLGMAFPVCGAESAPVYANDFEKAKAGPVPDDMMVLDGGFVVADVSGNKVLELPGAPLDTFGILFGPAEAAGLDVQARVSGTMKGRRYPVMGVGLNGVAGYRLRVAPAKKSLELFKGDDAIGAVPFVWESGSWTVLRLQSVKLATGEIRVRGKAWKQGGTEPTEWMIQHTDAKGAPTGRPSLWGIPYADTPIQFDDLKITAVAN